MIRTVYIMIVAGVVALTCSCGDRGPAKVKGVARVNEYTIGEDDFRQTLSRYASRNEIVGLSLEDKQRILDQEIRQELLIQLAIKQGIDKEPEFRQTIERYWEQTLIASLIKRQCTGMGKGIIVTREEIDDRCKEIAAKTGTDKASVAELRQQVEKEIAEEKKAKLLQEWTEELWKKADIKVYKENLSELR